MIFYYSLSDLIISHQNHNNYVICYVVFDSMIEFKLLCMDHSKAKLSCLVCDLVKQTFPFFLLFRLANLKGILQIISHCRLSTQPPLHLNRPNDRPPKSIRGDLLQAFEVLLAILQQIALFLTGNENARWHPYCLASPATFLNPNTNTLDILGL